jgi:glycosyltransferase involved in cell wall biosynthesis
MPKISVAICTWNRAGLLRRTLAALAAAHPPRRWKWELVVVLNNCTDATPMVLDEFRARLPIVDTTELRPGHANARNRAIEAASGDVILWTDDDVLVHPDWLCAYEQAFEQWPQAGIFGGPIVPRFEGDVPAWLQRSWHLCGSAFAVRAVPQGAAGIVLEGEDFPFGANFAIRADAQRRWRYDGQLGRRPGRWLLGGEELAVIRAILADGGTGRWVPEATVEHIIPQERQSVDYLRRYFEGHGYLLGTYYHRDRDPQRNRMREFGHAVALEAKYRWLRMAAGPRRWVPALVAAAVARGRWIGRYRPDAVSSA